MSLLEEIAALKVALALANAKLEAIEGTVARLKRENEQLKQSAMGTRRERFEPTAEQLALWEAPEAIEPEPPPPKQTPRRRGHGRRKLPAELPEVTLSCTVDPDQGCAQCGGALKNIGEDTAVRLDYVPGHFRRIKVVRDKCACPKHPGAGVVTAPTPPFALDRALCGDGLLVKIIVDKFTDHIPLDRQVRRFRREGVDLPLSTVCDWLRLAARPAGMLVAAMLAKLTSGPWLQSDATGFKVLEGSRNTPHRGHLYNWADTDRVIYTYAREGTGDHPAEILARFQGTLVADGGSSFNKAAGKQGVERAGCWAHARRKFFEARDADPFRVHSALETIREIFQLERRFKDLDPVDRARQRRRSTGPILASFRVWCQQLSRALPPKSPLAKAVGYVLRQWKPLTVFVDNGHIPAHSNYSELALRQAVIGRKNYMFAGSEGGAKSAATWYSLIGSCLLNAVDPWKYLTNVLPKLNDWPINRVLELEPAAWRASQLESIH
ncbi:MAG: transposase [Cognaticolwellia sp.]|jgi:transposase